MAESVCTTRAQESLSQRLRAKVTSADYERPELRAEMLQLLDNPTSFPFPLPFRLLSDIFRNQESLGSAAEQGQIKGLNQLLETKKTPDSFSPSYWRFYKVDRQPMILGDSCIVAVTAEGNACSLLQSNSNWETIYLPISRSSVLMAGRSEADSVLEPEEINRASAELSCSYVYCSEVSDFVRTLAPLIGSRAPILSDQEISDIVADGWAKKE
jgi:hypothetical protein